MLTLEVGGSDVHLCDKCMRIDCEQFAVSLPFRATVLESVIPGFHGVVVKCFESLECRLASNGRLQLFYNTFMADYLSLEHMSVAMLPGQYFIPRYAICKDDNGDTKTRVVLDAFA